MWRYGGHCGEAMNRLMICAGSVRREGWQTLDCKPGHDFVAMIPPLPDAVKAIQWDEIEWVHGITSFYPWDGEAILRECHSVLNVGGKIVLELPDASKCNPAEHPEWLFGDPSLKESEHMNRWAYTPFSIRGLLEKVGFTRIEMLPAQHHLPTRDFRAEAYR